MKPQKQRQRGELKLVPVVIGAMVLAAVAMTALISIRSERNLFAEGAAKASKAVTDSPAGAIVDAAKSGTSSSAGPMRKCLIKGKMVVSNTDCTDENKTSKTIKIQDNRGFEAPKKPPAPPPEAGTDKMVDKMIEKQLQ
ncbi:MAG: DUF4124 domain-containing protein [Massilia sp.]